AQDVNRLMFHVNLSRAYALLGKNDRALAEADDAVKFSAPESMLFTRLHRVRMLRHAEQFDKAVAECHNLLKETNEPGAVRDIRSELSNVYSLQRNYTKAEEQLQLI